MRTILLLLFIFCWTSAQDNRMNVPDQSLDNHSVRCMMCHNGTHGALIIIRDQNTSVIRDNQQRTTNHSIGALYIDSYKKDPGHYTPIESLNPNIVLNDGKVGCESCHVPKDRRLASVSSEPMTTVECLADVNATQKAFANGLCSKCHQK